MDNRRLTEDEVVDAVTTHFTAMEYDVKTKCDIQFGAGKGRNHGEADVVIKNPQGFWIAIVECKNERVGKGLDGEWQLKSYLSATDTRFGILASSKDPDDWLYFENLRSNVFQRRNRRYFTGHLSDDPRADRPDKDAINQLKTENEQLETDNEQLTSNNNQLKRKIKFRTIVLSISALILAIGIPVYLLFFHPTQSNTIPTENQTHFEVIRVIDGDTFDIVYEDQVTSVQLVGVDTPETEANPNHPSEPYGEEATEFLREFLLDKSIYLRFDISQRDKYNRLLGYVYRASDDIFVNLEIIREGYGEVDRRYPFKYEELFTDYESRAKTDRKGLWSGY